ncbi:MAG TPA: hypothetical protein VF526_18615 [Solirubrobacteraceae bacterium]
MRVVNDKQKRAELIDQLHSQPVEPVLVGEHGVLSHTVVGLDWVKDTPRELRRARERRVAIRHRPQCTLKELADDAVGIVVLKLVAARAQYPELTPKARNFAKQSRLTGARLADHADGRALASERIAQNFLDLAELAVALEQGCRRRRQIAAHRS